MTCILLNRPNHQNISKINMCDLSMHKNRTVSCNVQTIHFSSRDCSLREKNVCRNEKGELDTTWTYNNSVVTYFNTRGETTRGKYSNIRTPTFFGIQHIFTEWTIGNFVKKIRDFPIPNFKNYFNLFKKYCETNKNHLQPYFERPKLSNWRSAKFEFGCHCEPVVVHTCECLCACSCEFVYIHKLVFVCIQTHICYHWHWQVVHSEHWAAVTVHRASFPSTKIHIHPEIAEKTPFLSVYSNTLWVQNRKKHRAAAAELKQTIKIDLCVSTAKRQEKRHKRKFC